MAQEDNNKKEIIRPCANFSPSLWGDRFSSIIPIDDQTIDKYLKEIEELKFDVRCKLTNGSSGIEEKLAFIDILERVGISYLFQSDIEEELEKIYVSFSHKEINEKEDLSTVSLYFRLLRQHGFSVSSEIFDSFKDKAGFKDILCTDVKGLLNLYEAAHTRIHGEEILEEALAFTTTHLKLMQPQMPPSLSKHVSHTLEQAFCRGVPRVETRFFISLYDEEKDLNNDLVLRLAKLDYTLVQILHRKELAQISSWWKDIISKYPYARQRTVELYFWANGVYFEPKYSFARIILAKGLLVNIVIDDTFDAYGTIDELEAFTKAVQRWDISEIDGLPEYMKVIYETLLKTYASFDEQVLSLGRSYAVFQAKERVKEITQSYYIEAKRFIEGHTTTFEDYLENGLRTSCYFMLTTLSLLGMESATKETFEWLKTNPKIMRASATISRLSNDIANYETEKKMGQTTTGIDCYMKQYEVSKEKAMDAFNKIVENSWKDINNECLKPTVVSPDILARIVNLARLIDATYKHRNDGFNNPEKGLKPYIIDVLVDTFEIKERVKGLNY